LSKNAQCDGNKNKPQPTANHQKLPAENRSVGKIKGKGHGS